MMKEKGVVVVTAELWWSFERRRGWMVWSLWRADWRREKSGWFLRRRANTVMPVPPGTALHQLFSVPDTGRRCGGGGWSEFDMGM